jgi:hypothetical protein
MELVSSANVGACCAILRDSVDRARVAGRVRACVAGSASREWQGRVGGLAFLGVEVCSGIAEKRDAELLGARWPVVGVPSFVRQCEECRFQFGVTDDDRQIDYATWRADWLARGTPWSSRGIARPNGWDPDAQVRRIAP